MSEHLDYTFNWKDLITTDRMMKSYLSDRETLYNELFNSDEKYTEDDVREYCEFFMGQNASDMDVDSDKSNHHKYLYNIRHFLSRNYEFNILPSYCDLVNNINDCMVYYGEIDYLGDLISLDEFVSLEYESIENLKSFWNDYLVNMANYPMMHLENLKKTNVLGSEVYFDKKTDDFVLSSFLEFLQNVKKDFPEILKKFDRFLIVDNDYLQFLADDGGEDSGTEAFFTDDSIFLKCHCDNLKDEDEKFFYKEVLYHEFGHYVFECMPEYLQIYWQENYKNWKEKGLKMCRDEKRNSQLDVYMNELFADNFACYYLSDKMTDDDYIHNPSPIITDIFNFILRKAFVDK